jgi:transcriptional regulator with XRE-family HTH domain
MEFNEKLQQLRRQKGLTQEELAAKLYVSRTAISKWESGRGYPNIESLKAISKLFSVTVDELLSTDEILTIAEEDGKQKKERERGFIVGLLDILSALLIVLPFFAQKNDGRVESVPLLSLSAPVYLTVLYFSAIIGTAILGIVILVLGGMKFDRINKALLFTSVALSAATVLLFTLSLKPYAAAFSFVLLAIKAIILIKR